MMDKKYDLQPHQTPYPFSWFSIDIKLGCLSIHLDEDNWHKCTVSEMETNVQLMISSHIMDQGSTINYDIEEKDINLGLNLIQSKLLSYNEELQLCEQEHIRQALHENYRDFKMLFNHFNDEIRSVISKVDSYQKLQNKREGFSTSRTIDDNRGSGDSQSLMISMMYLSDKNTQKPLWIDHRFNQFQDYV